MEKMTPSDGPIRPTDRDRIRLAEAIIRQRMNCSEKDIADVLRALDGWSIEELVLGLRDPEVTA